MTSEKRETSELNHKIDSFERCVVLLQTEGISEAELKTIVLERFSEHPPAVQTTKESRDHWESDATMHRQQLLRQFRLAIDACCRCGAVQEELLAFIHARFADMTADTSPPAEDQTQNVQSTVSAVVRNTVEPGRHG